AEVEFKQAVTQNPNLVQGYNNLAAALHNQKNYTAALEALRISEPLAPRYPGTQNLLGLVHYSRGEFDLSIGHFKKSVQLDPKQPAPYQYLMNIYGVVKNDPDTAMFYAEQLKSLK
ncbi:MAG: tetratricopeptide repeat protein, partial [Nitrospinales bacterium]